MKWCVSYKCKPEILKEVDEIRYSGFNEIFQVKDKEEYFEKRSRASASHQIVRGAGLKEKKEVQRTGRFGKGKIAVLSVTILAATIALSVFSSKYRKAQTDLIYRELKDYDSRIGTVELDGLSGKYYITDIYGKYYDGTMLPDEVWLEANPTFNEVMEEMAQDNIHQPKLGGK